MQTTSGELIDDTKVVVKGIETVGCSFVTTKKTE